MGADTRGTLTTPWKGPADRFDPAHAARLLQPGEPDPAVYPVHPRGTWQRAMLFMSLGYRPDAEDMADLEQWSALNVNQRREVLDRDRAALSAIRAAAVAELGPDEVESSTRLARRLSGYPGVPHANRTMALLKTIQPVNTGLKSGSLPGASVKRLYLSRASGSPGHFMSRSAPALREFAENYAHRYSHQRRGIASDYWQRVHAGELPAPDHHRKESA